MTEDAAERRRYALLQAAATLIITNTKSSPRVCDAVDRAEKLLAEIERREEAEPKR